MNYALHFLSQPHFTTKPPLSAMFLSNLTQDNLLKRYLPNYLALSYLKIIRDARKGEAQQSWGLASQNSVILPRYSEV